MCRLLARLYNLLPSEHPKGNHATPLLCNILVNHHNPVASPEKRYANHKPSAKKEAPLETQAIERKKVFHF
jgi:hypothetical protein